MTLLEFIINSTKTPYYVYFMFFNILFFNILIYYEAKRNMLYSLFLMILIYLILYVFYIWMKLDFIGTSIILIYVGAIPILFLFIIMTIDTSKHNSNYHIKTIWFENKNLNKKHYKINNYIIYFIIFFICITFFFILNSFVLFQLHKINLFVYDLSVINKTFHELYPFLSNVNTVGYCLIKTYKAELYLIGLIILMSFLILEIIFSNKNE